MHYSTDSAKDPPATIKATKLPTFGFSEHQTAELLSTCSKRGIRFEAALHASVAAVASCIAESISPVEQKPKHHTSTLRHSLRPHLPVPYDAVAGAAGLYTAGCLVKVPDTQSWWDNAQFYESEYATGATTDLLCSRRQYTVEMKAIMSRAVPSNNPPPSGLNVSWVPGAQDLVDTIYTSPHSRQQFLRVDNIGISVDVLSRHVYVFAWMFNGRIQCRLAFNRAFYDDGFAANLLELVAQSLTSNLQVVS